MLSMINRDAIERIKQEIKTIKLDGRLAQASLAKRLDNFERRISKLENDINHCERQIIVTKKRYRLKLDVSSRIENNWQILAKNVDDGCYHIGSGRGSEKWQTVFTQAEIDAMGDIARGFVKEEICEK
jgi:hypothetical protein|nr:MAG TPA: hypothetical protein [Caudoviricetes sp.]